MSHRSSPRQPKSNSHWNTTRQYLTPFPYIVINTYRDFRLPFMADEGHTQWMRPQRGELDNRERFHLLKSDLHAELFRPRQKEKIDH